MKTKVAPIIMLGEGAHSNKVIQLGSNKEKSIGFLRINKLKNGNEYGFDEIVDEKDVGKPLVTLVFSRIEGIKKLADGLNNLYQFITDKPKFKVGDVMSFVLTSGEEVEAMAMKQEDDGMIFCFVDCLAKEYPMNKEGGTEGGYEASDLRRTLNTEILALFPDDLTAKLIPFGNGDLLKIPSEHEVFGKNVYGKDGDENETQWEPMKLRRNRIAFQGTNGEWEYWWLRDVDSSAAFALVSNYGFASRYAASGSLGVRPAFKI